MKVFNWGSINIDHVYQVDHLVRPGETLPSRQYAVFSGGKGFNQSIAMARAGGSVVHVGKVGTDGGWLLDELRRSGVDTSLTATTDVPTGHAVIQVTPSGENAIVLFPGANHQFGENELRSLEAASSAGDVVLLQNETNAIADVFRLCSRRGLRIAFNPAPMTAETSTYPLTDAELVFVNETEARQLSGETELAKIKSELRKRLPDARIVLTLGADGADYGDVDGWRHQAAPKVDAVDTTAAGDTFVGFFLAEYLRTGDPERAIRHACAAAAICVTRRGAANAIPYLREVAS